jgi:predicted nucleic acid-binding protein
MSQVVRLDANVILRFLRNDDARLSPQAASLFQQANAGKVSLYVAAITFSEVFYALTSFYKLTPQRTAEILLPLVRSDVAEFEHNAWLADALERVIAHRVDFGDAFLAASAVSVQDSVATFDRDFRKFKDVRLYSFDQKPGQN